MLAQPSLASRASTGFPVTVTNKAQMIRALASILVLIALLFGISIAAKDRKTPVVDPTRGAIGVSIKIKPPAPLSVATSADHAFFVKIEEGVDVLQAKEILLGRFNEANQIYLLNVEPGTYVAIGTTTLAKKLVINNVYFDKEMIQATAVTVEAGKIAFMGEIVAKEGFLLKNADEAQTYYLKHLGRGMIAKLQSLDRDSKTTTEFWRRAVKDAFKDEPDWQELARRQVVQR